MPRKSRNTIPGVPMHVVQRGNNRAPCFSAVDDYRRFQDVLRDESVRTRTAVHAYVLMTNHVHLLVTPREADGVSMLMQRIGRRYVRGFNTVHGRTGSLWEGRFRSAVIDSERYFLTCSRYIDLNPLRAGMVARPEEYPWSSYRANAAGGFDPLVTRHELFDRLGGDDAARARAYRTLCTEAIELDAIDTIRQATRRGLRLRDLASTPQP